MCVCVCVCVSKYTCSMATCVTVQRSSQKFNVTIVHVYTCTSHRAATIVSTSEGVLWALVSTLTSISLNILKHKHSVFVCRCLGNELSLCICYSVVFKVIVLFCLQDRQTFRRIVCGAASRKVSHDIIIIILHVLCTVHVIAM